MLNKEQFEQIEKDIRNTMEDYSVRVKMLNNFNGTGIYKEEINNCRTRMKMSNTLAYALKEYAKNNFNDIQTVMSRLVDINYYNECYGDGQGYMGIDGCIEFHDGIFCYEFKNNKLQDIYLRFESVGFGSYYSKYFLLETFDSEDLEWRIEITQISKDFNYSKKEPQLRGRRIR